MQRNPTSFIFRLTRHGPLPFRPLRQINVELPQGSLNAAQTFTSADADNGSIGTVDLQRAARRSQG